jgi:hypothetical protein
VVLSVATLGRGGEGREKKGGKGRAGESREGKGKLKGKTLRESLTSFGLFDLVLVYLVILGFELRAFCFLGRCSTTLVMPSALELT